MSMEFSRQEYWSGLSFPSPGIFPTQGSNLGLLNYRQILGCMLDQNLLLPFGIVEFVLGYRTVVFLDGVLVV